MVGQSAAMIRTLVIDALSLYSLLEIDDINLALLNIEALATDVEHVVLECEAALEHAVEPQEEDNVNPEDLVPFDWVPLTDVDYFDSDDSLHLGFDSDRE
jgi:hypothetical protein